MEGGAVGQILKWTYPRTIPARLGLILSSVFRGEHLNVKVYHVRLTDTKRWQKLKWPYKVNIKVTTM